LVKGSQRQAAASGLCALVRSIWHLVVKVAMVAAVTVKVMVFVKGTEKLSR